MWAICLQCDVFIHIDTQRVYFYLSNCIFRFDENFSEACVLTLL